MSREMSYHVCLNLGTALDMAYCRDDWVDNGFEKIKEILNYPDGTKQWEIIRDLEEFRDEGYIAIPSEGCDNNDRGRCKGHVKRGIAASKVHK